jgi:hypothetical protein
MLLLSTGWLGSSCTSVFLPPLEPSTAPEELEVAFHRAVIERHPVLVVTVTNRSIAPICIKAEALRPHAFEMHLRLRDAWGRRVGYTESGFLPSPLEGLVKVDPGAQVGSYYGFWRFKLGGRKPSPPRGSRVLASFRYGHCHDGAWSAQLTTEWQPI